MGSEFGITVDGLSKFRKAVQAADAKCAKALMARIKEACTGLVNMAKSHASWSSRIPGSITVRSTARGVNIKAGSSSAPHAGLYEAGNGNPSTIRHPTFGHKGKGGWVNTPTRPFLQPAIDGSQTQLLEAVDKALDDWLGEVGFK